MMSERLFTVNYARKVYLILLLGFALPLIALGYAGNDPFHGRWKLIDYQQQDEEGNWNWMNRGLKGYILYDGMGGMGVHQVPIDYDEYELEGQGGRANLTENDLRHKAHNFVYFGKYRIDNERKIIEHHIETHSNPGSAGMVARRYFEFAGDTLFLQPVDRTPAIRIVWERQNDSRGIADHLIFADSATAGEMLTTEDEFTRSWSEFDIKSRLHDTAGTRQQLLNYIGLQVIPWSEEEIRDISSAIETIDAELDSLNISLSLPKNVYLIKTTSNEEGSAVAYTRANYIVFQDGLDFSDEWNLARLLLHELFHVISRNDEAFRKSMYDIIGFSFMEPVIYPQSIEDLRITNPDAPQTDTYIRLLAGTDSVNCMMIIYSSEEYAGKGEFFDYVNIGFLALDENMKPLLRDGGPVIYPINEVKGFFEKIGNNTSYIIHPEEIMADNFSYAVTRKQGLPDQWIVDEILNALSKIPAKEDR